MEKKKTLQNENKISDITFAKIILKLEFEWREVRLYCLLKLIGNGTTFKMVWDPQKCKEKSKT